MGLWGFDAIEGGHCIEGEAGVEGEVVRVRVCGARGEEEEEEEEEEGGGEE